MLKQDLITVVIPIYNVEKYLKKCIESIIGQTYKDLEIILVDDGSPDNSGKICDEYANIDKRINVIHKENGGLSDARNYGIMNAHGKYIVFIDSDDYVENQYIELLYKAIILNNTKISQCGIKKINEKNDIIGYFNYGENQIKKSKELIIDLYGGKWENIVVWNKMYLRELFNNIKFPKGKIHEDEFVTYKLLFLSNEISVINKCLYNYMQSNESITGRKFYLNRLDILDALEERLIFFEKSKEEELYKETLENYLNTIKMCYFEVRKNINKSKKIQKYLKNIYVKNSKMFLKKYRVNLLKKMKMRLFGIFPTIYYLKFILDYKL